MNRRQSTKHRRLHERKNCRVTLPSRAESVKKSCCGHSAKASLNKTRVSQAMAAEESQKCPALKLRENDLRLCLPSSKVLTAALVTTRACPGELRVPKYAPRFLCLLFGRRSGCAGKLKDEKWRTGCRCQRLKLQKLTMIDCKVTDFGLQ